MAEENGERKTAKIKRGREVRREKEEKGMEERRKEE